MCLDTELRFSPDGRLATGKRYGTTVDVLDANTFQNVAELETGGCGQGIAFSADGASIVTPEGAADAKTFAAKTPLVPAHNNTPSTPPVTSQLTPDGGVQSHSTVRRQRGRVALHAHR